MADYNEQLLKKTIQIWQPHSPKPLSLDDAKNIIDNAVDLYSYLLELKEKYDAQEKNI